MKFFKKFVKTCLVLCLICVAVFLYARFVEPSLLVTTKFAAQVPADVSESKIVFFSDTHFGKLYDQKNIAKIVSLINEQEPDIVIFGGDFLDNFARDRDTLDLGYLQTQLSQIAAKHGKYAVYGNHDYGGGAVRIYEDLMEDSGFAVLKNSDVLVEEVGIRLTGFDDQLLGHTDTALYEVMGDGFPVVIAHEPDTAMEIKLQTDGLMLAGHSHGGQVWLPFITQKILPDGATTYIKGAYPASGISENISLYVSKGIGTTVFPYRLFNIPEIVVLSLTHTE